MNESCQHIAVFQQQIIVNPQTQLPLLFTSAQIALWADVITVEFLAGSHQLIDYKIVELNNTDVMSEPFSTLNLRKLLGELEEPVWHILGRGLQLIEWYRAHLFCSYCGAPNARQIPDYVAICSSCQHEHYPRINPCIMVLIVRDDKLLLVKSSRPNSKYYTLVTGFIEAGENAEQAVHREVMEEVGLQINHLEYHCSQSWPFPHALMLGFTAQYLGGELHIDANEIGDANWYSRNDLANINVPDKGTLSRRLIDAWLQVTS